MDGKTLTVKCPTCQRKVQWLADNIYRPFCSERCKLIDLGEWATEAKVIPGEPIPTESDEGKDSFFQ